MQTGSLDAAVTSSTSLISFRLQEISKAVTSGIQGSFWFMFEPLLMSKSVFETLTPAQQAAVTEVGASFEPFALDAAKADDIELAKVYGGKGVVVKEFDAAALGKWQAIARDTAWKDFAARNSACAELLAMAEKVPATA
jgi:TRAP-type C4-dicarboxylate transport system substrate-binding protein